MMHSQVPPPHSPYVPVPMPPASVATHPHTPSTPTPSHPSHHSLPPQPLPSERDAFYSKLHAFRDSIGEPIQRLPTLGFKELDLCILYNEVTKRNGIDAVIANKQWKEVAEALQLPSSCTDSGFRLRLHYKKYLEAFERRFFRPVQAHPLSEGAPSSCSKGTRIHACHEQPRVELRPVAGKSGSSERNASRSVTSVGSAPTDGVGTCSAGSDGSVGSSRTGTSVTDGGRGGKCVVAAGAKKKKRCSAPVSVPTCAIGVDVPNVEVGRDQAVPYQIREKANGKVSDGAPDGGFADRNDKDAGGTIRKENKMQAQIRASTANMDTLEERPSSEDERGESMDVTSFERGSSESGDEGEQVNKWSASKKRRSCDGETTDYQNGGNDKKRNKVDFSVLDRATLKRYAEKYDVGCDQYNESECGDEDKDGNVESEVKVEAGEEKGPEDLAENVSQHFSKTPLQSGELETLLEFIQAVRRVG